MAKTQSGKSKVGRPSKYRAEYAAQAGKLALLGYTDKQLAEFFAVNEDTVNEWKRRHKEFSESLKAGKAVADAKVAASLYQRALGYSHPAVKIFADPKTGAVEVVPYTEHYAPDPTSCIFWLKNRQRDNWRDKQEHQVTGKNEGPVKIQPVSAEEALAEIDAIITR